jgi:hypothetical protein
LYDDLREALNTVADELQVWRDQAPFEDKDSEQDCLQKILNKLVNFCNKFCIIFPFYKHLCEDFRFGEFVKIEAGELQIHPLRNFHVYMIEIVRALKPIFFGAKVITVLFQLPEKRFLDEFRDIKRNL